MKKSKDKPILDTVLCVSIEATCWEKQKDQPPGAQNEIIEFGICPVSLEDLTIGEPIGFLIKPITSKISPFCTQITTITQEMVDKDGISFEDSCKRLVDDFKSKRTRWISWGGYDKYQMISQCKSLKIGYPFGAGNWDLMNVFCFTMGINHIVKLDEALKIFGMTFWGTRHRGADEAYNIARVMKELFSRIRNK